MLPKPPLFPSNPLAGWAILALAVLIVAWIVLTIVGKAIKLSVRLAILAGVLATLALGLCWISSALGGLPLP